MEPAYFHDLDTERLEPGEKPVQGGLILDGAVQNGFDRLHRGGEPLEVEQGLGRYDPDYADLVEGRWHRGPQADRNAQMARLLLSCQAPRCAPLTTGEFVTLVRLGAG
jgi:hypothetical protein